jgi:cell division protein FtsQ
MSVRPLRRRSKRSLATRIRIVWVLVVLALIVGGGLAYALITAPQFRIMAVETHIEGRLIARGDVLARAQIDDGENIWLIHTHAAAARIAAIPYVRDVRVERRLPATVAITVTQRAPVACLLGAAPLTIDATLRVLQSGCARPDLIGIDASLASPPKPGETISDPALGDLVRDTATLASAGLMVRTARRDEFGQLVVTDATGVRMLFGDDADLAAKAALVAPIRQAAKRPLRAIDLRAPTTPVVSYR